MSLEKVTVEYTSKVDDLEAGLNKVKRANEGVAESAKKTGKDIEDGFVKGSNGAKRFDAELKRTTRTQAEMEMKLQKLKELLRDDTTLGTAAFKKVQSEVKKTEAEIDKLNRKSDNYGSTLKKIGALAAGAFALSRLQAFGAELIKTQREAEILANQFAFVNGNAEAGKAVFETLRKTSQRLGLDFKALSEEYVSFANAARVMNLSNDESLQIFQDMSIGLRGAGSSAEQQKRAFLALTQIMSKGRVQGEELTQQLGEALPGATGIAAKAMGVTTAELMKMMQAGQLAATDFIPKFAAAVRDEFSAAVSGKENSLDASINRASNSWEAFKRAVQVPLVQASVDAFNNQVSRTTLLLNSGLKGMALVKRLTFEYTGLASLNQEFLANVINQENERIANQEALSKGIQEEANRIFKLSETEKAAAMARLNMDNQTFESVMKTRKLIGKEITDYDTLKATLGAIAMLEANSAAAKAQRDLLNQENDKKAIELQKKKEQALKDYIKAINDQFQLLQEMQALDEQGTIDSIKTIEDRSKAEVDAKNNTVNQIAGTIQSFDEWQKQQMDDMLAESDNAYQTDVDNFKKAQSQKEQAVQAFIQAATQLTNNFFSLQFALARQDAQLQIDNNRNLLDTKAISEEEYNARVLQIKRDQFTKEQNLQRAQAIMNGALAVTEILSKWASVPPVAAGLITLTAASVGLQLAAIDAQTPGFKDGVIDLQGEGNSTSDSITARLSRGESVMTAEETRQHKADLMAMREGNWNDHIKKTYIMPELNKIAQKESRSFAQNVAASMGANSFDDTGIIHALRKKGSLDDNTIDKLAEAVSKRSKVGSLLARRGYV
jgi:tape measure domain-containing protein